MLIAISARFKGDVLTNSPPVASTSVTEPFLLEIRTTCRAHAAEKVAS